MSGLFLFQLLHAALNSLLAENEFIEVGTYERKILRGKVRKKVVVKKEKKKENTLSTKRKKTRS